MSEFQSHALMLAQQSTGLAWLSGEKQACAKLWQAEKWPTRKTEAWRYTSLQSLESTLWSVPSEAQLDVLPDELMAIDATRLVFVNGYFSSQFSSELPESLTLFSQASAAEQQTILTKFNQVAKVEKHLFSQLNTAALGEGVFLSLSANQRLEKPVYVVHIHTDTGASDYVGSRLLVALETSAEAVVIEHFITLGDARPMFNAVTELDLGENAKLKHYRISMESEQSLHLGSVHAALHANSQLTGFTLATGSRLKRIDYHVRHVGSGADLDLQGIYLPKHNQRVDYHTNVEHCVPHCTTNEVFRGVISDTAKAVFNGRIHIHQDAQKTLAEMSNRNLLTSNRAEINTKPELEIYADDVKCAHGATISQLNDESLFYLVSRGISEAEARVMLSFGFVNELVENIAVDEIKEWLRPRMAKAFGQSDDVVRHLIHDESID